MTRSFRGLSSLAVAFALSLMMLNVTPAAAQSNARVEGNVTDNSSAVLPGVTVTATNLGTNASRTAVTDRDGAYTITPLAVGDYRVQAELSGFRSQSTPATLTVGQVSRIDFKLDLGSVSETVTVLAAAPLIEKTTSQISTLIDEKQVENLPLNGRNVTQLTTLSPGVNRGTPGGNATGGGSGTDAETFRYAEFGGMGVSVNGLREQFNNYLIEGVDNNQTLVNSVAYLPSPEAVQEFAVITTNAPAEYGRAGGGVQNMVLKSGKNTLDGSLFYFLRPRSLAATPEFVDEKPDFKNEDFGLTLGGPIIRDRTFFFGSFHGLKNSIPTDVNTRVTVPTAKMREGDFSELLNGTTNGIGQPVIIYDPLTGVPFPNNVIPASRINAIGRAYLSVFPMPDPGASGVIRNYLTHRLKQSTYNDWDLKLDQQLAQSDQLFVSGSLWSDEFSDPGRIPGYQAGFGSGTSKHEGYALRVGESHLFSNNLVNELRIGYSDFEFGFLPVGFGTDQNQALGIPGTGGITTANGISLIGGGDGRFIEYLGDFGQYLIQERTIQLSDAVTWLRANHTFKFGGMVMRREMAQQRTNFGKGFYFFRDAFGWEQGYSGYEVSDMLMGNPTTFTITGVPGFVPRNTISWENGLFVQDDWHVNPRLTLNLGLRWDVYTPYYEEDDKMANFDPATQRLVLPGQNGAPRSTVDTDMDNLGPRLGFNFLLNDKTAVRGGYGIFYALDRGGIDNQLTENPPAVVTEFRGCGTPGSCPGLHQPIPLPAPSNPQNPSAPGPNSAIVYVPRDSETTEVQQWNLGIEREVFKNTSVFIAYVGSRAENMAAQVASAGTDALSGSVRSVRYIATSSYDSLQVSARRSESNGLSYLAAYTFGEARNNSPGFFPGRPSNFAAVATDPNCGFPDRNCNLDLDEGPADGDARHRFTFAGTYELPFARGNALLGGWSVNTVLTLQSGTPFTVYSGGRRADQVGDPNDGPKDVDEWFNTGAFRAPTGAQGTAEKNSVRGPGIRTLDLSLFKMFQLARAGAVELRIEGFNVLDTPQYSQPNQFLGDSNFGKITATRLNSERQVQLAARYIF